MMKKFLIVLAAVQILVITYIFTFNGDWLFKNKLNDYYISTTNIGLCPPVNRIASKPKITLIKAWGLLKYYHPGIVRPQAWDEVFKRMYVSVSNGELELDNDIIKGLLNSLPPIPVKDKAEYFTASIVSNADLCWIESSRCEESLKVILRNLVLQNNPFSNPNAEYNSKLKVYEFDVDSGYYKAVNTDLPTRVLGVARYWNIINYFYPYKEQLKNWNESLVNSLNEIESSKSEWDYQKAFLRLIEDLNDSHAITRSTLYFDARGHYLSNYIFSEIDSQIVLTGYRMPNLEKLLPMGAELLAINDQDIKVGFDTLKEIVSGSNWYSKTRDILLGTQFSKKPYQMIRYKSPDGSVKEDSIKYFKKENFEPIVKPAYHSIKEINPDLVYVKVFGLTNKNVDSVFGAIKKYPSIILDMRGYGPFIVPAASKHLISKSGAFWYQVSPDERKIGALKWYYRIGEISGEGSGDNRITVLVDETTQSSSEFCVMALQFSSNVTTIGSSSAGADGNVIPIHLPGGMVTYFSGLGVFYPSQAKTQGKGVMIDYQVFPTLQDIRDQRDVIYEKAIELNTTNL